MAIVLLGSLLVLSALGLGLRQVRRLQRAVNELNSSRIALRASAERWSGTSYGAE